MSNIITVRDPGIIAAEINMIKRQVQEAVIYGTIRIGEKLCEAKSLVAQGEWGRWLEENVEYSQSTAENLMKLYREYGGNQESLFDTWTNSQMFGKLTYTQHLALLALPFADRQEFAEANNVAEMSTRQLQDAVRKQLEEEQQLHAQTREDLESTEAQLRDAEQNLLDMQQRLSAAKSTEGAWQQEIDKLGADKARAEKSEATALDLVKKLEKQLAEATRKEKAIQEELKKAQESPEIPEAMMEQLRKEAEAEAARKAADQLQEQLAEAKAAKAEAEKRAQNIQEQLVAAQKRLKAADPDMMEYHTLSQKLMADYTVLDNLRRKMKANDKEIGAKLEQFQKKMVSAWAKALGI